VRHRYARAATGDGYVGAVVHLNRDPSNGSLYWNGCLNTTPAHSCYAVDALGVPSNLTLDAAGRSVYFTAFDEHAGTIGLLRRDTSTGNLYWDSCVRDATHQAGACATSGVHGLESGGWDVALSPDGQSVYATSNGLDWAPNPSGLVVFNRDLGTGKLAWAGCFRDDGALNGCARASGLDGAAGLALTADGTTVYVASMFYSAVTVLSRAGR
jgi:DNA-binding beta-propeller fold protein YncE